METIQILLVEDNEGDILLIQEAFGDAKIINKISVVKDGEKAIFYLKKSGEYKNKETPDLVILDINLPRRNGHEVLEFIKTTDSLKHIPVIMLTTSSSEKDISSSYQRHANCYITKPVDVDDFLQAISGIENFWVKLVKLPAQT